jgi:hypothetical protein
LAAQAKDPTTTNALLARFDNDTENMAVGAQNTGYLAARNAGLGPQQAAAGMFGNNYGTTAKTMSDIGNNAYVQSQNRTKAITGLLNAPLQQGSQDAGANASAAAQEEATRKARQGGATGLAMPSSFS